jgi:tetratricopeptide (TPR) repeat protein
MKIRFGLVLITALGLGACAGGASSGGSSAPSPAALEGGHTLQQGERPRQDEDTRAAQRALDQAQGTEDEAQAETLYAQALTSARAAIAADSTNPLAYRLAGEAAIGAGEYEQADQYLDRAEALRPIYMIETEGIREQAWLNLYNQAAPLVQQGDYEGAANIFEKANAIYDQRPEVMITLGQIYAQLREHDKALANLDKADSIIHSEKINEVDSATAANWRESAAQIPLTKATVLADAGRFEEAATLFRQLVAENPDDVELSRNLAAILIQMGNTQEAFQVYDNLLNRPGLTSADLYNIGVGFYQGEDYTRAAQAFRKAADVSPKDRDAIEMWTRSLQIDSAYAQVPPAAERWIELDPNNQNAYLILAQAVNHEGDSKRASDLVNQIEALKVLVADLQLNRTRDGVTATGSVLNKQLDPGASVTLNFTFYDTNGNQVTTASKTVTVGAVDAPVSFEVDATGDGIAGYGSTLQEG